MANLIGTSGNNRLVGTVFDDMIQGLGGNDTLEGGDGADILSGGAGDDILIGGRGADTLNGGEGNDTFRFLGAEEVHLDRITDFGAGDRIDLSAIAGLTFIGERAFSGRAGEVRFSIASGITTLQFDLRGFGAADAFMILDGAPRLVETAPGSRILVLATAVNLSGSEGADALTGGAGNDILQGNGGNDTLSGGAGEDVLIGGAGDDVLIGGAGADTLTGGAGNDIFRYTEIRDLAGDVITDFGYGDRIDLSALKVLRFISDNDFSGTPGEVRQGGEWLLVDTDGDRVGDVALRLPGGGALAETASGSGLLIRVKPLVMVGTDGADAVAGTAGADVMDGGDGNDVFYGLAGDDRLFGGAGDDYLAGRSGNDILDGGTGNDTLVGDGGDDILIGGAGDDLLIGGLGRDVMSGGPGKDTLRYYNAEEVHGDVFEDMDAGDSISLRLLTGSIFIGNQAFSRRAGEIRFDGETLSIDKDGDGVGEITARINTGGRLLDETSPGNLLLMLAQDRSFTGTAGADTLNGRSGNDVLNGLGGNDTLNGGAGDDVLNGGAGDDVLNGGAGNDTMTGGEGADTFAIEADDRGGADVITDFGAEDRLRLSGKEGLTWIGDAAFSGARPEVRQSRVAEGTLILIDGDGDGVADQTVLLRGAGSLVETAPGSLLLVPAEGILRTGTAGKDTLTGGAGNDRLVGEAGDDLLQGQGGSDTLEGGLGNDTLQGGAGDDILLGGEGDDILEGGTGADILTGGGGADTFRFFSLAEIGLRGDRITDFGAGDRIDLSALRDFTFLEEGLANLDAEIAVWDSYGGISLGKTFVVFDSNGDGRPEAVLELDGDLALEETAPGSRILVLAPDRVISGGGGHDSLRGGAGSDILSGGGGNDRLEGKGGNDRLRGGAGNDTLLGGLGEDWLYGEDGDDVLEGGAGNDRLMGGAGRDLLIGGLGADNLTGGMGDDIFRYADVAEMAGDVITDFSSGDILDLSALQLRFIGMAGFEAGGIAQIRFFTGSNTMLQVDSNGDGVADAAMTLRGVLALEEVAPGSGLLRLVSDLVLTGTAGADTLVGGSGRDTLRGLEGDDQLSGGAGNDLLEGGAGDDMLNGGLGDDVLTGGAGNDRFVWSAEVLGSFFNDKITDFGVGDILDLSALFGSFLGTGGFSGTGGAEFRQAGAFLYLDLDGDGFSDSAIQLAGLQGLLEETEPGSGLLVLPTPLLLTGTGGAEVLTGRGNADTLQGLGGDDTLRGGGGNDLLEGGAGNDLLFGDDGDDILVGGAGADLLTGGAGNDRFVFGAGDVGRGAQRDVITDFSTMPYTDLLDLAGIDANLALAGDQAFVLIGGNAFTAAGQLRFFEGVLYGNIDSDLEADFEIAMPGVSSLSSWHFHAL